MPKYDPKIHHRRSVRLKGYDYSQNGAYFVTICAYNKEYVFGDIVDGNMVVNEYGHAVQTVWDRLPSHYLYVELDEWIVMPNHVHGIVCIVGAGLKPAPTETKRHPLPEIVRALKTFSSRHINQLRNTPGQPVWQRNYHEHIIRNDRSLEEIREYIANNPQNWEQDELFLKTI